MVVLFVTYGSRVVYSIDYPVRDLLPSSLRVGTNRVSGLNQKNLSQCIPGTDERVVALSLQKQYFWCPGCFRFLYMMYWESFSQDQTRSYSVGRRGWVNPDTND